MSAMTSRAPCSLMQRAHSSPIPRAPPVTTATLPSRSPMSAVLTQIESGPVLAVRAERALEETGEGFRRLPSEALQLGGVELDRHPAPGRRDLKALALIRDHLPDADVSELIRD